MIEKTPKIHHFKNLLISDYKTSVIHLTWSQGCPSALPTLNLRLTDTCSRLLMRLTAGGKQMQKILFFLKVVLLSHPVANRRRTCWA